MKNEIEILYVSYDGILEPLGESQVLGYLEIKCWVNIIVFGMIRDKQNEKH